MILPASHASVSRRAHGLAIAALLVSALCLVAAFGAVHLVRRALTHLAVYTSGWEIVFASVILGVALLFWPAGRSFICLQHARHALAGNDIIATRIETARARDFAYLTFGWGAFALMGLGAITFVLANDAAVGKTFFPAAHARQMDLGRQSLLEQPFCLRNR